MVLSRSARGHVALNLSKMPFHKYISLSLFKESWTSFSLSSEVIRWVFSSQKDIKQIGILL